MTKELQQLLEEERAARIAAEEKLQDHITRSEKKAQALNASNAQLLAIVDHLENGILFTDEEDRIVLANQMFCDIMGVTGSAETLTGISAIEYLKNNFFKFTDTDSFFERREAIVARKERVVADVIELVDGRFLGRDYDHIVFANGQEYDLWTYRDITERKRIEHQLDHQRGFYEQILNGIPADIAVFDNDHRYLFVNPVAIKDAELRKWLVGKTDEDYCRYRNRPLSIAEERNQLFQDVVRSGKQKEWEERLVMPDGTIEYLLRKMYPVFNEAGQLDIMIGYGLNITDRKHFEEQLILSEARYREIFNYSQALICTHDLNGKLLSVNPAICKTLGYPEEVLTGMTIHALMPDELKENFRKQYLPEIIEKGKAEGVMVVLDNTGERKYFLYQNYFVHEPGNDPYVIGFAQDISSHIHAKDALRRSEEKYRHIIENMNMGMLEIDKEGHILYANQRFCDMTEYRHEEMIGQPIAALLSGDEEPNMVKKKMVGREMALYETYELPIRVKSGAIKWCLISAAPSINAEGHVKGSIGIVLDITEQKKIEGQLIEAKLEAEYSSQAKEVFLANLSHEIRTPMNAIMGLGRLMKKTPLNQQQEFYTNAIHTATENLLVIINDVLDISKIEAGKISFEYIGFNIEALIRHSLYVLNYKAEEKQILLQCEIDKKVAPVLMGDPYRINQILMNMLSNAIKFTEQGSVDIACSVTGQTEHEQQLLIRIQDTGVGISEEFLSHLFDKFSQEDESIVRRFGGTGLGMSISRQLIELMGGEIEVESKKDMGTTIIIRFGFNIGTEKDIPRQDETRIDEQVLQGKKVLLVEDNDINRLIARTVLEHYGAHIIEAVNGLESIEKLKRDTFDIILMDMQMPVMDGLEATRTIRREINNTIPIIALTANAVKGEREKCLQAGMNDFISKPFDENKMVLLVANWLGLEGKISIHDTENAPRKNNALYDLTALRNISRGDEDFVREILEVFITETPLTVRQIKVAFEANDLHTLKALVHRIKPSFQNMGISILEDDLDTIEKIAIAKGPLDKLPPLIENLSRVLDEITGQIKEDLFSAG